MAHAIGNYFHNHGSEDSAAHLLAHAALGAAVAAAGGNNALVGAASAAGSEAAAPALAHWLYGKDAADLTTEEKQTISSIVGLASAAIGAATGNSADIVSGAQIGQNAVDNNYLSEHQQKQRDKELIECQGNLCKIKVNGKWLAINGEQQGLLTLGIAAGLPEGVFNAGYDFGTLISNPIQTYNAIKELINSDDIFGTAYNALKQEYSKRIDNLITEYEKAGVSGAFNAGREIGKLLTDIGTLTAGGIGAGKGIVKVTDKVVDKLAHESMYTPELAGVGNIKLPADTLADGTPLNKKPAKGSAQAGKDDKVPYEPNQGAIANMGDYFKQPGFGSELGKNSRKTSKIYQGQTVYVAKADIPPNIKAGDQFYLDGAHKNHIEVFNKTGNFKSAVNLDGTQNQAKTKAGEGRKLPK